MIILSCIFGAFSSLGGILKSRTLGKKVLTRISMEIFAVCFCLPKRVIWKRDFSQILLKEISVLFLIPPSKDSCFWCVCFFTDSTPMKMHHTKITIKICLASLGGSISGKHSPPIRDPQERPRSGTKFPLRSS